MRIKIPLIVACMALTNIAQAAVQVTQSITAPTEDLIRNTTGYDDQTLNWSGYGTAWRDTGQAFLAPGDFKLEAFTFELIDFESQALGTAFTVNIFETDASGTALEKGILRSSQHGSLPGALEKGQFITFTLEEAVTLTEGKYYTVMLHYDEKGTSTGAGSRRLIKFAMGSVSGENPLGTGSYFWRSGIEDFEKYSIGDKVMSSYFQGTAVPEAGHLAMLMGGGLLSLATLYRPRVKEWLRRGR